MRTIQQPKQKDKDQEYQQIATVSFRVPRSVRRELRRISFEQDIPMQELGTQALTEFVERNRK